MQPPSSGAGRSAVGNSSISWGTVWCDGIKLAITELRMETQSCSLPTRAGGSEGMLARWARQEMLVGLESQPGKLVRIPGGLFLQYD